MSLPDSSASNQDTGTWTWASIEPGLWVAQQDGEFAGMVEEQLGLGFDATNESGQVIGRFPNLADAQAGLATRR